MSRVFRIEKYVDQAEIVVPQDDNVAATRVVSNEAAHKERHKQVMAQFAELKETIADLGLTEADKSQEEIHVFEEELSVKRSELVRLKDEMRAIYQAIDDTKTQILTIKESGTDGKNISRAAEELSEIVKGTEEATNRILNSAEIVEQQASNLVASLQGDESQQALACEIQDSVMHIFEACNFQDLTGQRITTVVKTFCFIEQRLLKMMEIWGGAEGFMHVSPEEMEWRQGDGALLNGPSLQTDDDVASQDDIDALFD